MEVYGFNLDPILGVIILLISLRVFLPGIIRPLRPKPQSTSTLNIKNRLKGEDIQEMSDVMWSRVQWLANQEVEVVKLKSQASANSWMKYLGRGGFGED